MDIFGQTLDPRSVKTQTDMHIARHAEVIFIKRSKRLAEPGALGEADYVEVKNKYLEHIKSGLMVQNSLLMESTPDPDSVLPRYVFWQISTGVAGAKSSLSGAQNLIANADVQRISVKNSINNISTATITIRNPQDKYVVKRNPLYIGQPVFESNDLVYVNLPGMDNKLYRAFTGLITTVTKNVEANDALNTYITIECTDMLKPLWESRTNVRPSFNTLEAQGAEVSMFNTSLANKLPHEVLAEVLTRTYCDWFSIAGAYAKFTAWRRAGKANREQSVKDEEAFYKKNSTLPQGNNKTSPFLGSSGTLPSIGGTVPTLGPVTTTNLTTSGNILKNIPKKIYGFWQDKRVVPPKYAPFSNYGILADSGGTTKWSPTDLAFVIEGIAQPVWEIAFANYSITTLNSSDWKSSYELVKKVADDLNYELNTTPEGIVVVRPMNNLLPADPYYAKVISTLPGVPTLRADGIPKDTKDVPEPQRPRVGYEYWLKKQFIKSEHYRDTDNGVFTISQVTGRYVLSNLNETGVNEFRIGRMVDSEKRKRLGCRMAPQQQRLNLTDQKACEAYATTYLLRMNAKAKTGTVVYTGDARITSGNPCYIPHNNRVYYIETVQHEFVAGSSYSMTLSLTYGRDPIAILSDKATNMIKTIGSDLSLVDLIKNKYSFDAVINEMEKSQKVDNQTVLRTTGSTQLARYKAHGPNGDGQLVFNGFVWEDLPTGSYSELITDYLDSKSISNLCEAQQNVVQNSVKNKEEFELYSKKHPELIGDALITSFNKYQAEKAKSHGASRGW